MLIIELMTALSLFAKLDTGGHNIPAISTDRPDFTEGSRAVPYGTQQLEMGVSFEEYADGGSANYFGEMLIRSSAGKVSEFRVSFPTYIATSGSQAPDGFDDFSLGYKRELNGDESVEFAVLGELTVPTGHTAHRAGDPSPLIALIWASEAGGFGVAGQIQAEWSTGPTSYRNTFVIGKEIGPSLGVFAEYVIDFGNHIKPEHLAHFGLTYQPTPNNQWDVHFAFGIENSGLDSLIGFGYSTRY